MPSTEPKDPLRSDLRLNAALWTAIAAVAAALIALALGHEGLERDIAKQQETTSAWHTETAALRSRLDGLSTRATHVESSLVTVQSRLAAQSAKPEASSPRRSAALRAKPRPAPAPSVDEADVTERAGMVVLIVR